MTQRIAYTRFLIILAGQLPPERIITDSMLRLALGTDASFYRLVPQVVIRVESEREVIAVMAAARVEKLGLTFRAAGTSLSGQAVTDSILVVLGDGWGGHEILDGGAVIRLQPGVIGQHANDCLRPYGRKIGPDPASIGTCKIGGIAANNASGMCCGTRDNSYHTMLAMRLVLADGSVLDTADPASVSRFRSNNADLLLGLTELAEKVHNDVILSERIRHKFRLKNTTGYGLNALLDFTDPVDMLIHLMIGSEGTLGFIARVDYRTVVEHPHKASALLLFDRLDTCCHAVSALAATSVSAVELMDGRSLSAVAAKLPDLLLSSSYAAGLLIEVRAPDANALAVQIAAVDAVLAGFDIARRAGFSAKSADFEPWWAVRKGLFPAVGAARTPGSTVVIEDVTFPVARLAAGVAGMQGLFDRFGYTEALLFGHALEGNLHIVFAPRFDEPAEVERYRGLMAALAQLVAVDFDGALKGEHGTGRNMAPFVALEWGMDGYAVMQRIKALFDPEGILNPGVILNADPDIHLKNLKPMPVADPLVDKCIECGFCEPVCPSHGLTLSPRQRIVVWRQLQAWRQQPAKLARRQHWLAQYRQRGIETCATTGMCATRCPVGIDTGKLMHQLSDRTNFPFVAQQIARHYRLATAMARSGLRAWRWMGRMFGPRRLQRLNEHAHQRWPRIPLVPAGLVAAAPLPVVSHVAGEAVVVFPSCPNRVLAGTQGADSELAATLSVLRKAGFAPRLPLDYAGICCGQPFASGNALAAAVDALMHTNLALLAVSNNGDLPVYLDNGPCGLRLIEAQQNGQLDARLRLFAAPHFLNQWVLPRLAVKRIAKLALHVPCSIAKQPAAADLRALAAALANEVVETGVACCGFAGDKGMTVSALNAHALRHVADRQQGCDCGVSASRTCQIGLNTHSGLAYDGIEVVLDRQSNDKSIR
ncbi:4Fe-4S ferredoxin [Chitinimonas sp. BJB300]|nr:4Fe-4S ferredoxin [Chitinimonas sp. BJB300]TSJ91656.1 FAD-binding oxidoreductase [Chitinimonas sp. BJB300]